jgi:uroporphyrinogen III methyltransferase / synthase
MITKDPITDRPHTGKVILVGAGPGDPGLITVRGREAIAMADVIVYDYLANEELLSYARPEAEKRYVGKQGASHSMEQRDINDLLFTYAKSGKTVVRLKGGDPYIFGRGAEEVVYCQERGVEAEVVPGIPAAIGAAAYAGIPLTDRRYSSSVAFVTGHEDPSKDVSSIAWEHLAKGVETIVFYMGINTIAHLMNKLVEHGLSPDTPVAVVEWATLPRQRVVRGTLVTIAEKVKRENITPPALSIVGGTNRLGASLNWYGKKPLIGRRIIVTRSREQASSLVRLLRDLRADTVEIPAIISSAPDSWEPVDAAIASLHTYDWTVFTSVNGVDYFMKRLLGRGGDARRFGKAKIAAIGPATAERLTQYGIVADLKPEEYTSDALFDECARLGIVPGCRYLLLRADIADKAFSQKLASAGAHVEDIAVYKTLPAPIDAAMVREILCKGDPPGVTFTSSSTVKSFALSIGDELFAQIKSRIHGFSIGPKTSEAMRLHGMEPAIEAAQHTIPGLVDAIVDYYSRNKGDGA